jgi:anti-sigma regulatory factor (Ser/Thr protein kinase)
VVHILMPSRRAAVGPTVEKILKSVKRAHLTQEQRDDLAVAVAEALSNAAVHGNRLRSGTRVDVTVEAKSDGETCVEVRDSGSGFDVRSVRDPTDPSHLLLPGGRGVFIMRRLVDEVEYNKAGNSVSLKMRARGQQRRKATKG